MLDLSGKTRSNSSSQASSQDSDFGNSFVGKSYYEDIKDIADSVPLLVIFKRYGIFCNQANAMIKCPFSFHKGGRENTASFKYYDETNSFYCHGCHKGGGSAHASYFVSLMEGVSMSKAAQKIIELFKNNIGEVEQDFQRIDTDQQLVLMMDFSQTIREFLLDHLGEEEALIYAEEACRMHDKWISKKTTISNEALAHLIEYGKQYIGNYNRLRK